MSNPGHYYWILLVFVLVLRPGTHAIAVEHVLIDVEGRQQKLSGKIVIEDSVGNMLLETDEGALWPISAETILDRTSDSSQMVPLNKKQLSARLLQEMGPDFQVHESKHYVVVLHDQTLRHLV